MSLYSNKRNTKPEPDAETPGAIQLPQDQTHPGPEQKPHNAIKQWQGLNQFCIGGPPLTKMLIG